MLFTAVTCEVKDKENTWFTYVVANGINYVCHFFAGQITIDLRLKSAGNQILRNFVSVRNRVWQIIYFICGI